ncbi:PREDICTED: pleckstrin homology domain-containing family G member 4B-like isoform X2 [Poecilia mexicana]|uniref:pleckstrin homology domain-containing family G member 4B-like isoform X2 n=1 Tax=Poecilia mexicana TaxID=48701 RepID=UPI00072E3038|nr:PREDICTED: pleckstrin homology domain-containing family G member 4B-like isoform X2 [Poecilia mexicana]
MNPESLDLSIQSALSALFPPFEVTAPIVLCQLFRTIDERYHGDALQCLLDFLIPSKHLLESVQQAACAGYSDVVFRCEGWPLCLHDKTVIQLASVNPLLLRPGDFYLQVEPFGDQAARIVLKSLLEEGCREVEETPIPETSYPCLFTEEWLQDINEGRHGTPLSRCLLCTDQGVIKLPWSEISIPEFLDKPKAVPACGEAAPQTTKASASSHFNSSTLPVEAVRLPQEDRMSASLRLSHASSKLIKMERRPPRSGSKPLNKPVGWVSPNTWESLTYQEMEGDYVDLVDIEKGKEFVEKQTQPILVLPKPVRQPPPVPLGNSGQTLQYAEEPCVPCGQRQLDQDLIDLDMKYRYRDSYVAALKNPVPFERGGVDLLGALDEVGLFEDDDVRPGGAFEGQKDHLCKLSNHCQEPATDSESCESAGCHRPLSCESENAMKESAVILNPFSGLSPSDGKLISHQLGQAFFKHPGSVVSLATSDGGLKTRQKGEVAKPSAKHKVKVRSMSALSDTPTGSPILYKINNRSHSDVCPETVTSIMRLENSTAEDQEASNVERLKGLKKDSDSSTSSINGLGSKLFSIKVEKQPFATGSGCQQGSQTEQSCWRKISSLLELGIICLPGSRDRNGRAVVEVHGDRKEWMSPLVSAESICELLLYLHSIPRKDVRELGMTLVINGRKKPPPLHLYKALLMAQEQALHAVHSIVMVIDKDSSPRPEKQPGLQMDVVTSTRALSKTVEAPQLTSDLGGTFAYNHKDWMQFHQKHVPFMANLRGANSLLQRAIKRVDRRKQMDSAEVGQEVQESIQEQRVLMKEVLEDDRLVTLQKEGGTLLARMKKDEFRFLQSEDYRDALELATSLYNQVEEKLHMLVMKSNESLQHLENLLRHRDTEAKIISEGLWFSTEGEQILKKSYSTDDTLVGKEKAMEDFNLFLTKSKDKQQYALMLIKEAEEIIGTTNSSPAAEIFRTLVGTFKSNVEDFVLRAEQRQKDLMSVVHLFRFCKQATDWAKECRSLLDQVEEGCCSSQTLNTLQMQRERLAGEFSAPHFQALRAKASVMGAEASGMLRAWNAAWIQSQEVKQRLEEMQEKHKGAEKNPTQQTTAANPLGEQEEEEREGKRNEPGEARSTTIPQQSSHVDVVSTLKCQAEAVSAAFSKHNCESDLSIEKELLEAQRKNSENTSALSQTGDFHTASQCKSKEHHNIADLSGAERKDFPAHQTLGRSLSEGSYETSVSGFLPLSHKHCHGRKHSLDQNLQPTQKLQTLHQEGVQPDNLSCESKRDGKQGEGKDGTIPTRSPEDLRTSETLLTPAESNILKVQKILEELLSTEREYVKALGYVREHYFPELERADVPQDLRGQRGSIFGNLEKLHDFHRHYFSDELESCVKEPFRVGRCFLRHRESFALYALYSKNKPQSDSLLTNHGKSFFKQKQLKLGDKMDLWSYLLKPVQRISKYNLLLQDVMRECGPEQTKEVAEIKAALEVIHFQLRHGNNLLAMDAIRQCDVNLKEQGQLIRQDEFSVTFRKKKCLRHIFLFQDLVLFSKTRKTDVGNDTYVYKQSFKTSDIGMTQNSGDSGLCFEIWFRKRKSQDTYTLQAGSREAKEAWTKDLERILWEQAIHNREVRMQERVFLGIGNKPFMDIQPSEAAISDRAINYVLIGRENKALSSLGSSASQGGLLEGRPKSVGSGSSSSSSSSSGRGSMPPIGFVGGGPKRRVVSGGLVGYVSPPGSLEEDEMDRESGNQNLLLDSSESSGESVSGFSSCSHSCRSAAGEMDDSSSVCASIITLKEVGSARSTEALSVSQSPDTLQESAVSSPSPAAPRMKLQQQQHQTEDLPDSKAESTSAGKSTEV